LNQSGIRLRGPNLSRKGEPTQAGQPESFGGLMLGLWLPLIDGNGLRLNKPLIRRVSRRNNPTMLTLTRKCIIEMIDGE